ncbi:hypothetical protein [uncultured Desulfovibrio sp.]|uniref:hypothetical protein n=1 Tax=uncultured Desulfovibrio sp. TaxID=167968 RepID=UPI00262F7679|nr:hypothetical protein [uncultured Desulfovibrio sp.]
MLKEMLQILMERDGMSRADALQLLREVQAAVYEAFETGEDPEEIFTDMTGLEPDYLLALIV